MTDEQLAVLGKLTAKMQALGVEAKPITDISVGPILSVYRFMPHGKTKYSQLEALAQDFAITLGVEDVFVKRLPGEASVAVFVPNAERKRVKYTDTIDAVWQAKQLAIPLNMGVTYLGEPFVEDLTTAPHMLIAGSTGAGKSTFLSAVITALITSRSTEQVQLILSDTKGVEFTAFHGVPHLMFQPATSVRKTLEYLDFAINEMESRLSNFASDKVKNILEYNTKRHNGKYPYIVIVFDELADITQNTEKESDEPKAKRLGVLGEEKLCYIAQKARATGIHMLAATQRPSVNVINGSIKANFPARLTLKLVTEADSRTVLGTSGAEHLLSRGDMLYLSPNRPNLLRLHAPWTESTDVEAAVEFAVQRN